MEACAAIQETPCDQVAKKEQQISPAEGLGNFSSHMAQLNLGVLQVSLRVLKMNGSTMLFICNMDAECIEEIAMAMPARSPSDEIVSTTVIGESGQSESLVLANKLSKRYKRQFYVSLNLKIDLMARSQLEAALVSYMRQYPDLFV